MIKNKFRKWLLPIGALALLIAACDSASKPGPLPQPSPQPPVATPPADITPDQRKVWQEGIAAVRSVGNIEAGAACVQCHSPDLFEIARFNFTDDDIRRRALPHLPSDKVEAIVRLIKLQRERYKLQGKLFDPVKDRPLQPGGQPYEGATSQERDFRFTKETLAKKLPTLFARPITSMEQAYRARDELVAFDTRKEQIGIPFPRISEDIHHGPDRGSVNDWMSDHPNLFRNEEARQRWFKLQDAYLEKPTDTNFWAMFNSIDEVFKGHAEGLGGKFEAGAKFSRGKFRSLQQLAHALRQEASGVPYLITNQPHTFVEVPDTPGKGIRIHDDIHAAGSSFNTGFTDQDIRDAYPPEVLAKLSPSVSLRNHFAPTTVIWWYMGWVYQPHLDTVANRQEYFPGITFGGAGSPRSPYIMHSNFVRIKMEIARAYQPYPRAKGGAPVASSVFPWEHIANYHILYTVGGGGVFNQEHANLTTTFQANVRRMQLYLALDQFRDQCAKKEKYRDIIAYPGNFVDAARGPLLDALKKSSPENAANDERLIADVTTALEEAYAGCEKVPPPGNGTGVNVEVWPNTDFSGPSKTGKAYNISLGAIPKELITSRGWSARWTGKILPRFTDEYTISHGGVNVSGPVKVYINNQEIPRNGKIKLQAGQLYDLRMDFSGPDGAINLHLDWRSNKQWPQTIPQSQLFPPN